MQQFSPWIAGFPGLIWSIDIPHSRLKVFNRWSIPGLDVPRLLKDARYRKKAVRREDHALLMEFWDMLTARRPAAVTFRLTNGNGTYILQGWPGENDTLYYGFLKEAFLPAAYSADGRPGTCQMDIGGIGYPVFALDIPTRGLLIINDAARSLFAAASRDPNTLGLADIAPGGLAEKLLEAGNKALANDAWAGTLTFSNAQRGLFSAKVRLTPCGGAGEGRVVRVALLNIPENRKSAACPPSEEDAQTAPRPLREGLESLFAPYAGGTRLRRHHRTGHRTLRPALAHRGGYAGQHQVHRLGAVRPTRHPLLFRQTVLYGAGPARHPHPRQPPPRFLRRGRRNPLRQPHGAF